MITINNTEYRNLTEQVLKNKEDIARHYEIDRVIADFGIRVLGRLDSVSDLPAQAAVYGDAYAIGTETPYDYYVWTRANEAIGEPVDYWLDIGSLAIPGPTGPQGEQGVQGPQGIPGSKWSSGRGRPTSTTASTGDQYLDTLTGIVYEYTGSIWEGRSSIKGPQGEPGPVGPQGESIIGPQGPQGERGDVGGLVNIAGILSTIDMLPTPQQLQNVTIAYLIGAAEPYDLYIQAGSTPATASWTNAGPFNTGTLIFDSDSNAQNILNLTPTISANNQGLVKSGDIYTALRNGSVLPINIGNNNQVAIGAGSTTGYNQTMVVGQGNVANAAFTYAFGRAVSTNKQNQVVLGTFSQPNTSDNLVLAAGTGTGAGQVRKNALVANEQRVQVETAPAAMLATRNIWLDTSYDVNRHYIVPFGDLYAIYDPTDGRITDWYVGQN